MDASLRKKEEETFSFFWEVTLITMIYLTIAAYGLFSFHRFVLNSNIEQTISDHLFNVARSHHIDRIPLFLFIRSVSTI